MTSVVAEKPPCAGAQRYRVDGREFWTTGGKVIRFIEKLCVFTDAKWTGQPFKLEAWQKKLLYELFEVDPITGLRRFRRALIGIPRKNGKTELCAALALYLMLGDGELSAKVYCAAGNEDQADLLFQAAKNMCVIDGAPLGELVKDETSRLTSKDDPRSFFQRLSSKGKTKHGLNVHGVIFDELHVWGVGDHDELWSALTTGSASRDQPLQIAITTAGTDLEESRCGDLYQLGRAMESGEAEDETFFFRWWQAPDDCDYRDPAMWKIASPNYGVSVNENFLKGELSGSNVVNGKRRGAVSEADFRRLYLNQWVEYGATPWVQREQIQACRVPAFTLPTGEATWLGVDLSRSRDSTAIAWGQWMDGDDRPCKHTGEPCLYVKAEAWERPRKGDGSYEEDWQVPLPVVRQFIRDKNAEMAVQSNVFDPYGATLMTLDLAAEGLTCETMHQQGVRRSSAATGTYDLIIQKRLHYDQDIVERHIMNATVKSTGEDGYYLQKRKQGKMMDVAQAISQVVYGTIWAPAEDAPAGGFFV